MAEQRPVSPGRPRPIDSVPEHRYYPRQLDVRGCYGPCGNDPNRYHKPESHAVRDRRCGSGTGFYGDLGRQHTEQMPRTGSPLFRYRATLRWRAQRRALRYDPPYRFPFYLYDFHQGRAVVGSGSSSTSWRCSRNEPNQRTVRLHLRFGYALLRREPCKVGLG